MRDKSRSLGAFVPANTQAPVLTLSSIKRCVSLCNFLTYCVKEVNNETYKWRIEENELQRWRIEENNFVSGCRRRRLTADVEHCLDPERKLRTRMNHLEEREICHCGGVLNLEGLYLTGELLSMLLPLQGWQENSAHCDCLSGLWVFCDLQPSSLGQHRICSKQKKREHFVFKDLSPEWK